MHGFEDENCESVQSQPRKEQYSDSGDESISDEEDAELTRLPFASAAKVQGSYNYNFEKRSQDQACAWSEVLEQVNELAGLHTKTPNCSIPYDVYEVKKGHKVGRGRVKPKFSIRSEPHDKELPWSHEVKGKNEDFCKEVSEDPVRQNYFEHRTSENLMTELLENLQKENDELPAELLSHKQSGALLTISELLDNVQNKDIQSNRASNMDVKRKNRRIHSAGKRMLPHLGTRILDDEDPLEVIEGGMSSEDEDFDQNQSSLATQKSKGQTMTELFQKAFSTSTEEGHLFPTSRLAGTGYHGRLQQVMQIEKDKHLEFLKQLQTGKSPLSDSRDINVQILSRSLEAKLTVCHCLLDENNESSPCWKGSQKCIDGRGTLKRMAIFNSKICDNVELEVGNLVRIHSPWKEVQVSKDEKIILCTYFSLVMA